MEYNPLYMDYTKSTDTWIIIISEKWTYLDEIVAVQRWEEGPGDAEFEVVVTEQWNGSDHQSKTWKRSPKEVILRATIKIWVTKIVYSEEREQIEHLKNPRKGDAVKTVMTVLQRRCDKRYRTSYVQVKKNAG